MTERFYTSFEQSKALMKLGLDESTAELKWQILQGTTPRGEAIPPILTLGFDPRCSYPAWTLSALLRQLPDVIQVDGDYYTFSLTKNVIEYVGHDGKILYSTGGECFVDAAVEMLIKLGGINND